LAALLFGSAAAANASARIISPAQDKGLAKQDPCNVQNYRMESFQLTDNSDKSTLMYSISLSLDPKKGQPASMFVIMTVVNCKGETQTIKTALFYDAKTNTWNGKQAIKNNVECPLKLQSYSTVAVNECGDEYATDEFEIGNLKSAPGPKTKIARRFREPIWGKINNRGNDSVNNNDSGCNRQIYMMDAINLQDLTDNSFLSYALSISFSAKAAQPATMEVLMTIVNCKNEKQTIKTKLTYDAKTNTWTGKEAMLQNKECPWKLSTYTVIVQNICGEEFASNENETSILKAGGGTLSANGTLPARDRIVARRRRSN